jgi:hypothetical protein
VQAGALVDLSVDPAPFIRGTHAEEAFGHCAAIGDLDGDGEPELAVGAPGLADNSGGTHGGAVFVFGVSDLSSLSGEGSAPGLARWMLSGSKDRGRFGAALALGDLDADGVDDLVVAAPSAGDDSNIARGEVSVYFGGREGSWSRGPGAVPDLVLVGTAPGGRLGSTLLAADIDGDGSAELLVAEPGGGRKGAGVVYLLSGAALRSAGGVATVSEVASGAVTGENAGGALAGVAVADTDGDGEPELILGADQADGAGADLTRAGRIYVVPALPVLEGRSGSLPLDGTTVITGVTGRGFAGRSISAGDIDLDGIDDLLVSAYGSRAGGPKLEATGEAFVLFGDRSRDAGDPNTTRAGLSGAALDGPTVPRFTGGSRSDLFGLPVLLVDLNGDGADDIVAAAQYADGPGNDRNACGEVYVYWGSLRSVMLAKAEATGLADVTVAGASPEDSIGGSLLVLEAGKVGSPSLIIGAPGASAVSEEGEDVPRCGKLVLVPGELILR